MAVVAAAILPLALGAPAAGASSCTPGTCAPLNVVIAQPGNNLEASGFQGVLGTPLSDLQICGIENDYAPLQTAAIDTNDDDPNMLNRSLFDNGNDLYGTEEGNYTDSQAFQFNTAGSLVPGNSITVSLPHPAEPYSPSGSLLPNATVPSPLDSEQTSSTVVLSNQTTNTATVTVTLVNPPAAFISFPVKVELDAFDPYNPAPPSPGGGPGVNPSNGFDGHVAFTNAGGNTVTANSVGGNYVATFQIKDTNAEDVVFGATDVSFGASFGIGVVQTALGSFNGGAGAGGQSGPCAGSLGAPSSAAYPYLIFDNNNAGHLVSGVTTTSASGAETATLQVPSGVSFTDGQTVRVDVLDATSPPGSGTQSNAAQTAPYPASDFSVVTNVDPVPGYPNTVPKYIADATNGSNTVPNPPVDPTASNTTLTVSATTAQVTASGGPTATATLSDHYNNPVNDTQVSIFPQLPTHASVTPQGTPTAGKEYPTTTDNGMVSYSVADSCAETVTLHGVDVDDDVAIEATPSITFTAGPPAAPNATPPSMPCGSTPSSVTASTSSTPATIGAPVDVPADGTTNATIKVTLADQFGNLDKCQQVVLTPNTPNAVVVPQDPTNYSSTATDLPGFTGTDGVATFKVTDSHVEDVILGVIDQSSSSVWPSDTVGTDVQDVAQLDFEGTDAGQSTVTPPNQNSPVDAPALVTVSLFDAHGDPLDQANQVIALVGCSAACNGSNAVSTTTIAAGNGFTSPGTDEVSTNGNGQAVFDVASTFPQSVYYQATDESDNPPVVISAEAVVNFTNGGATLVAAPSTVVAGLGTSTLTYTLSDTGPTPVSGATVSVTPSSASAVAIGPAVTNGSGQVEFTASDTKAETVTFVATATFSTSASACPSTYVSPTCTVKTSTTVTFISAPTTLSAVASPVSVPADGVSSSQVTVTALDAGGKPISGLSVVLSPSGSPAAASAVLAPPTGITGTSGSYTFSVTDTLAGSVVLTPQYFSSALSNTAINCSTPSCTVTKASIGFTQTEGEASTITVGTPPTQPADGVSAVCVTVTLQAAAAIPGHAVALYTSSPSTTVTPYLGAGCVTGNVGALTNSSGLVSFGITDTNPETLTLYGRDLYTGVLIGLATPTLVTFVKTEAQASTVVAVPTSLPAGGQTTAVTVTLQNKSGFLTGKTVSLSASSSTVTITSSPLLIPPTGVTNGSGQVTFQVSDSAVETVTLTALDVSDSVTVLQTATVTFTATEANQSTVTINPITTPASGPGATLTVVVRNASGQVVPNETVHAIVDSGSPAIAPLFGGITNVNGLAQFSITDTHIEKVTLSACDFTLSPTCSAGSPGLLNKTASVTFTAGEANQSTISSAASTVPAFPVGCPTTAAGWTCPTTTVTVTLRNAAGPISGDSVSLSSPSSTVSITPAIATSNSLGQAVFTVGDSTVGSDVFTALDRTTGATVVPTVSVAFTANEQNQSKASGTPLAGATQWTITVTLRSATDAPLVGHKVTLNTGSHTAFVTTLTAGAKTTAAGVIQFRVTDTVTQVLAITVTDTTAGVTLYAPVTISIYR
jgi:hypothetical protein